MFKKFFKAFQSQVSFSPKLPEVKYDLALKDQLLKYQAKLGDATTQKVFDANLAIASNDIGRLWAVFSYHPVIVSKYKQIFISDRVTEPEIQFINFSHEARHAVQNQTNPNFHLVSRVVPEKSPFCKHICEVDANLLEGEKSAFKYIKDKNENHLRLMYDNSGIGLQIYADTMGLIKTGNSGDMSFESTKAILDKFPKIPSSNDYIQTTRAFFCHHISTQKHALDLWDSFLLQSMPITFAAIADLTEEELALVAHEIFAHDPTIKDAETLLYMDNPSNRFLDRLPNDMKQEFWNNTSDCSEVYKANLIQIKEESLRVRKRLGKRFP